MESGKKKKKACRLEEGFYLLLLWVDQGLWTGFGRRDYETGLLWRFTILGLFVIILGHLLGTKGICQAK